MCALVLRERGRVNSSPYIWFVQLNKQLIRGVFNEGGRDIWDEEEGYVLCLRGPTTMLAIISLFAEFNSQIT